MNKPLRSDILLELHVPSFEKAKEFYSKLGYEVVWEKPADADNGYLVMRNGESIINFYCGTDEVYRHDYFSRFAADTPRGYGVEIIIPISNITPFYEKFGEMFPKNIIKKLSNTYTKPDFRAVDPFGFYLRFVERYNWVDERDKTGKPLDETA
jgi:catechol 2,3-dioxygenase-like lactoylglutathione lyase family enzyme